MNTRSTFIAILAILLALPVAAETLSGTCGDNLSWTLNTETGVLDMTGFGSMNYYEDAVSIPWYDYRASIRTINLPEKMTGIAPYAFFETQISSITIPDSVCYINRDAFEYCKQLTSVTLPDGLLYIHEYAFAYCTKLLSLTIPSSVKDIYWSAFDEVPNVIYSGVTNQYYPWGAKSINGFVDGNLVYRDEAKNKLVACSAAFTGELTIPESVTTIGNNAFAFCENITKVTIPNTTIEIEASAFENCTNLRTISLPDKINQISKAAFYMCENLESIIIPNSVEFIYENAFNGCKNMTKVTFGNAVEGIYRSAFWGCETLTSISLPASLRYIRETAFGFCKGLSYVKCEAITPPSCESNNVFIDVPIIPLYVPAQSISAYEADKNWTFYSIYSLEDLEEDDDTPTTSGDVLTVAQAITIVDKLEDGASSEDTVTVEGYVVNAEKFNPLFKNQIFYLADDASNSGAQRFQAHFCRAVENGDTVPDMNGDKVRLTGKLTKYINDDSSVLPEIHLGTATFVSKVEGDRDLYKMSIITVSQALTFAADLQTNETGTTEYIIHGFVTSITENTYNTDYKSMTFWMADEKTNASSNAEDAFYVYRGKPDVELQVGDEVYVDTKLKNYNGTIESETGVSVRFIEPAPDPADQRTVTLKVNNAEWGTVSGGGIFKNGETAMITAVPASGYQFSKWSDGSNENPREVVVSQDSTITAIFIDPNAKTIYLNTTGWWWDKDSYYVSSWKDNNAPSVVKMTKVFDYIYKADINKEHTHVIYYDATSSSLEEVNDRTETLIILENEDLFKITLPTTGTYNDSSWGYWSVYDEEKYALYYDYGSCGENVTFTAGRDSLLTISGNGDMNDYLASDEGIVGWTPWVTWYYDSISLPEGLTKIGTYAFDWASAKHITIPSTVSTIGSGALNGSIKSIVCKAVTPPAIKEVTAYNAQEPYHFYGGSDFSIPVYVPAGSVQAYKAANQWKDFTNIQAIDGSGEGGGEGGGPEPGMRAIYLVTSPSYWYNDQDYYIQSWQYESNPTTVKMDYVADYLYRAYIDENHTTAYFFYMGKGESYTSIDNVWEGDKTKTTIPSDKDMYILTSSYMGVWSALEYGEWAKYDAEKSIQNFIYGTTGEVEYAVRRDSTFIITGAGSMEHYETNRSEENPLYYWPQWKGWSSYVTSVSLPEGLTVIGAYSLSFYKVKSVTIPSTVSVIGSGAFYAKNYTSITCKAVTPPTITARTTTEDLQHFFRDVDFSIPLYVPAASVSAYQSADYWKEFTNIQAIDGSGEPSQEERTVTLKVNNAEWGTVSGGGRFYNGDTITITATPNDGYVFVSWSNGDTNMTTQFVVGGNVVIIAQFAPLPQAEPIALNMNAVEIDYYPSYNSDKGYDYFLILYTYEDNAVKVAPLVAFDIYTSVHKDFAGEYNLAKDNVEVKYGAARIPSTSDGGYDEYDLSDAAVTITINADNSYTLTGYITVSTGQVYNFEVTDNPYYCDVEHENEPETPKTLNLTMVSGEINMQYIDKGKIYLNFLTADSCKVVLSFGTADSTAVDIKDGTYSITQNTKETFWAGRSYNSNVYYSYAAFGDDRYYLTSGSVTITTITTGRFISVNASSYYGSQFKFTYLIENPAEQKYSIFVFANDSRLGTVTGGGQYVAGTQVTLTATPANGSRFEKWSNGSTENMLTITVTSEATYVAIFKAVVSSTADETDGYNQYDVKGGVVEPWTNESGHLPQNTDSTEDNLTSETPSAVSVKKIMRDGQLYILRNGGTYNAQGARVE